MHNLSTKKKGLQQVFHSFFFKEFPPKLEPSSRGGVEGRKKKNTILAQSTEHMFFTYTSLFIIYIYIYSQIYQYVNMYIYINTSEKNCHESIFSVIFIQINKIMSILASSNNQVVKTILTGL